MKVGVPKEVKNHEYRVAITPIGVHELTAHGHDVYVERNAGLGSQIENSEYEAAGAKILDGPDEVWGTAEMVLRSRSRSRRSTTACARARPCSPTSTSPPTSR